MQELKKINNEIKGYINQANFISQKKRNKLIKLLGEEFSIDLPIENFATIDVVLESDGSIIMRGDKYSTKQKLTLEETIEIYNKFKEKAEEMLNKTEINYYNKKDINNILNIIIVLALILVFIVLSIYTISAFLSGSFLHCIWLFAFMSSWLVPGIKDRFIQAKNFIKRKIKK